MQSKTGMQLHMAAKNIPHYGINTAQGYNSIPATLNHHKWFNKGTHLIVKSRV
ncbi:hypothetical protein [Panacibacter ginsenosidivorans]|uniref:hypothetical protein n=1 Tax=Panacibacter ginsenosidivorans TaxID=1813871 RepID=UPI001315119C|nr:hypothetical protein [Panacibacter ginsenosidivorans]